MLASFEDAAIGGAITAAITALAGAVVLIYRTVQRSQRTERKDQGAVYEGVLDRYEQRIKWLEEQGARDRDVIGQVQSERSHCQWQMGELYDDLVDIHAAATRHREALVALGKDPGEVPKLRPRPAKPSGETDRQARTSAHDAQMLQAVPKPKPDEPKL